MSCTYFLANERPCSFFSPNGIHSIDHDRVATLSQTPICFNHFTHEARPQWYQRTGRRIPEADSYCECMRNGEAAQISDCEVRQCDRENCSELCHAMHQSHAAAHSSAFTRAWINGVRDTAATDTAATDTATQLSHWQIGQMAGVRRARTQFFDRVARATAWATRLRGLRVPTANGHQGP